jgi:hypothetical protein
MCKISHDRMWQIVFDDDCTDEEQMLLDDDAEVSALYDLFFILRVNIGQKDPRARTAVDRLEAQLIADPDLLPRIAANHKLGHDLAFALRAEVMSQTELVPA